MIEKVATLLVIGISLLLVTACSAQVSAEQTAAELAAVQEAVGIEVAQEQALGQEAAVVVTIEAGSSGTIPLDQIVGTPILEPVNLSPDGPFTEELVMEEDTGRYRPIKGGADQETAVDQDATEPAVAPALQPWINEAKADLALRHEVAAERVSLVAFESKVWSDAGLGCPQPGMRYKQVMVEGYLIRLELDGKLFDYHGGGGRGPFLCEGGLPAAKEAPGGAGQELLPPPSFDD